MDDQPVWQSEEWREARSLLLADKCVQCASTEKLSLVHLWKPPRYRSLIQQVEETLLQRMIEDGKIKPFDPVKAGSDTQRKACPNCESINLRERKTKSPVFKCGRCSQEFDETASRMVRDQYQFNTAYREWKVEILSEDEERIKQRVEELQAEYDRKYRSGEGTTTMCGKCAFLWTQKQMKLCENCKEHYHKRKYQQCYQCHSPVITVPCEHCGVKIPPQIGDINICADCTEKMWDDLTK